MTDWLTKKPYINPNAQSCGRRQLSPLLLALCGALMLQVGCSRYELDRQMAALCEKDGGVKVYETITLSSPEYDALLKARVNAYGPDYRYVTDREILVGKANDPNKGNGRLSRVHNAIYRRSDGRLQGEQITYYRLGGDFLTFGFQSSANFCPKPSQSIVLSVFAKGN